jgi:hypothetical protein
MPGTELQRVVDEDDDVGAARGSGARGSRTSGAWDWNKICAYHTNRVVRIQDANLGLVTSADGEGIVKIPMGYARDAIN